MVITKKLSISHTAFVCIIWLHSFWTRGLSPLVIGENS